MDTFSDYFEYIILRLAYPRFWCDDFHEWRDSLSILRKLEKMAYAGTRYTIQHMLLNAADYGVPQTRERVSVLGIQADIGVEKKRMLV